MSLVNVRKHGILFAALLSFIPQPAWPAELPMDVVASCSSVDQATVETAASFDGDSRKPNQVNNGGVSPVSLADWRSSIVGEPIHIQTNDANGGTRAYMWFLTASKTPSSDKRDINLSLATSSDGTNFVPISETESPYHLNGEVLSARDGLDLSTNCASAQIVSPMVQQINGGFKLTFCRLAMSEHKVSDATIVTLFSNDGVRWKNVEPNPMKVRLVGNSDPATDGVRARLHTLAAICSQMQ